MAYLGFKLFFHISTGGWIPPNQILIDNMCDLVSTLVPHRFQDMSGLAREHEQKEKR